MNCTFCQKEMVEMKKTTFWESRTCKKCKVDFRIFIWNNENKVVNMFFYAKGNAIGIDYDDKTTTLWIKNEFDEYQSIFSLKYIADVNPSNVVHWFERLSKLKAFS
jgi:hypothetical protein